jgi:hypothetical protein
MIILFGHRAYQPFCMNGDTINTGLCQHNLGLEIENSRFQARNVATMVTDHGHTGAGRQSRR